MKNRFCGSVLLVLLFGLAGTANAHSQQNIDHGAIIDNGERYMFMNANGSLRGYLIVRLGGVSVLIAVFRTDIHHNIISGIIIREPFTDSFRVPSFASETGRDAVIRRVTGDTYAIDSGYVTMVRVPAGFWSEAFLDVGF